MTDANFMWRSMFSPKINLQHSVSCWICDFCVPESDNTSHHPMYNKYNKCWFIWFANSNPNLWF